MKINLFELEKSKRDRKFLIEKGAESLDAFINIIETCTGMPVIGPILKLGKVAISYLDWRFINKLSIFLKEAESIDDAVKKEFINSLTPKEKERISSYMLHLLYVSEEDEKASMMAYIYKARLMNEIDNEIDNEMMLRLSSIIQKSFLHDLKKLPQYKERSNEGTMEASNFINWGLIDNHVGGLWIDEPTWKLNEVGLQLCEILKKENWFDV